MFKVVLIMIKLSMSQFANPDCFVIALFQVAGNYFSIGSTVFSRTPGYKAEGGFDPAQFAENYTGVNLYEYV